MRKEKKKYRILIVDDNEECLKVVKAIIPRSYKDWEIDINTVHIQVEKIGEGNYCIATETISEIASLSVQPFDLILMDFGYRHKDLKLEDIFTKCPSRSVTEFEKYMLNPHTLVTQGHKCLDNKSFQNFYNNFECFNKTIHVYTYNSTKAREFMPTVDSYCENKVKDAFQHATVNMLDTRKELFNDAKFEKVKDGNDEYYYFILAKYLKQLIILDISNNIFNKEISDARHIKIKQTSTVIGALVLFCSLLGASTQFFGSLIVVFFQTRDFLMAIVFILFTLIIIIFGGTLVLYFIKKILPKLLNNNA